MDNNTRNNSLSIEEQRRNNLACTFFVLIFICILAFLTIFFLCKKNQKLEKDIVQLKSELAQINTELSDSKSKLKDVEKELKDSEELTAKMSKTLINSLEQCIFFDDYAGIITTTGNKYHTYECQHWDNGNPFYIYNIDLAIAKGYEPCLDCH